MKTIRGILTLSVVIFSAAGTAQPVGSERILLPVALVEPVPGANGSLWQTRLAVLNTGAAPVRIDGINIGCPFDPCVGDPSIIPGATFYPSVDQATGANPGHFLRVPQGSTLTVQLRVQDISRQAQTWGTAIPAVPEKDARTSTFNLLDVPGNAAEFRSLLRIYSFDESTSASVRIRIFRTSPTQTEPLQQQHPDELLVERTVDLAPTDDPFVPPFAQLPLWNIPELADVARVRIEVEPTVALAPIWAFVSVTNNATQHVTVVVP